MKKNFIILTVLILFLTLTSCSKNSDDNKNLNTTNNFEELSKVNYPSGELSIETLSPEFINAYNNFTNIIVKKTFTEKENQFISPVSLYIALAMLSEGISDIDALNEVEALLGMKIEDARNELKKVYRNNYYHLDDARCYIANSIWFKPELNINNEYVTLLSNHYYANSYKVNFRNNEDKQKIVDWINHYTEDLLDLTLDKFPIAGDLALLLINTIYYNANWQEAFNILNNSDNLFYLDNKQTTKAKYMEHIVSSKYQITDEFTIVEDYMTGGNTVTFIMLDNNFDTIMNLDLLNLDNNLIKGSVRLTIPQFETFKTYELTDTLKSLGIKKIFEEIDMLGDIANDLYVSYVRQDTGIKVDEIGIEAAAVTSIAVCESASMTPSILINIKLDQPFIYLIKDQMGLPIFVGYIYNPSI